MPAVSRKYTPTDFIMSGRRYLLWRQARQCSGAKTVIYSFDRPSPSYSVFSVHYPYTWLQSVRLQCTLYSAWPRCSLVLVLQGLCRTPSGDINTFQHWPLFSSCWLGLRGKPCALTGFLYHFCHATLLWSILRTFVESAGGNFSWWWRSRRESRVNIFLLWWKIVMISVKCQILFEREYLYLKHSTQGFSSALLKVQRLLHCCSCISCLYGPGSRCDGVWSKFGVIQMNWNTRQ